MAYEFKKLSDVNVIEEMKDGLNMLVEDGGEIVKISANSMIPEDYIPSPAAASIGQTIVVKSVDENGKPTEWEAVTLDRRISFLKQGTSIIGPKFAEAQEIVSDGHVVGNLQITGMDAASQTLNIERHRAHSIVAAVSPMTAETMYLRFYFTLSNGSNVVYQLNPDDTITEVTA